MPESLLQLLLLLLSVQEEIKIISVEVYVNPYAELDEEEEKINDDSKAEDEDNVSIILFLLPFNDGHFACLVGSISTPCPSLFSSFLCSRRRLDHGTATLELAPQRFKLLAVVLGSI